MYLFQFNSSTIFEFSLLLHCSVFCNLSCSLINGNLLVEELLGRLDEAGGGSEVPEVATPTEDVHPYHDLLAQELCLSPCEYQFSNVLCQLPLLLQLDSQVSQGEHVGLALLAEFFNERDIDRARLRRSVYTAKKKRCQYLVGRVMRYWLKIYLNETWKFDSLFLDLNDFLSVVSVFVSHGLDGVLLGLFLQVRDGQVLEHLLVVDKLSLVGIDSVFEFNISIV